MDLVSHAISVVSGDYYSGNIEEQEKVKELEAKTILDHSGVRIHDKLIVDYGPGFGTFLNYVQNLGAIGVGVEIDEKMVEFQRSRTSAEIVYSPSGRFNILNADMIVISGVMIHMDIFQIRRFAEDASRSLRSGGVLMYNTFESSSFFRDSRFMEFFLDEENRYSEGLPTIQKYVDKDTVDNILRFYGIHPTGEGMSVISGCYKAVKL